MCLILLWKAKSLMTTNMNPSGDSSNLMELNPSGSPAQPPPRPTATSESTSNGQDVSHMAVLLEIKNAMSGIKNTVQTSDSRIAKLDDKFSGIQETLGEHATRIYDTEKAVTTMARSVARTRVTTNYLGKEQLSLKRETTAIRKWVILRDEEKLKEEIEEKRERRIVMFNDLKKSTLAPFKSDEHYDYKRYTVALIKKMLPAFEEDDLLFVKRLPHNDPSKFRLSTELSSEVFANQVVTRAPKHNIKNCRGGMKKAVRDLIHKQYELVAQWNDELPADADFKYAVKGAKMFKVRKDDARKNIAEVTVQNSEDFAKPDIRMNHHIYDRIPDDPEEVDDPLSDNEDDRMLINIANTDHEAKNREREERKRKRSEEEQRNKEFFEERSPSSKKKKPENDDQDLDSSKTSKNSRSTTKKKKVPPPVEVIKSKKPARELPNRKAKSKHNSSIEVVNSQSSTSAAAMSGISNSKSLPTADSSIGSLSREDIEKFLAGMPPNGSASQSFTKPLPSDGSRPGTSSLSTPMELSNVPATNSSATRSVSFDIPTGSHAPLIHSPMGNGVLGSGF